MKYVPWVLVTAFILSYNGFWLLQEFAPGSIFKVPIGMIGVIALCALLLSFLYKMCYDDTI